MTELSQSLPDGPLSTEGIQDSAPGAALEAPPAKPLTRAQRALKIAGWVSFALGCLLLFTLVKLPEDRIKGYVQGLIAAQLAHKGITFTAERGYVSFGLGISYVMKNVTLNFPPPEPQTKIEKVTVTPSILPALFGYQGASIRIVNGDGTLNASFSTKGTQVSGSFTAKLLDLGKLAVFPLAANIRGGALLSGSGSLSGDMALPSTFSGSLDLTLAKVVIDQQPIMGFSVPRLVVSDGKIEINADKGKATIKTFRIGKAGNAADDIQATITGDVVMGRSWDSSTLSAKANFKLSDNILKSFILIDALLGAGKQGDGSYSFALNGPVFSPASTPIPAGSK